MQRAWKDEAVGLMNDKISLAIQKLLVIGYWFVVCQNWLSRLEDMTSKSCEVSKSIIKVFDW